MFKKYFMFVMLVVCLLFVAGIAVADDYTVTLSTYDVVGSTTDYTAGAYPNIAAGAKINRLIFTNAGSTIQTISCYDTATSTTLAAISLSVVLPTTGTVQVGYALGAPFIQTNFAVKKSATGSVVTMSVNYD